MHYLGRSADKIRTEEELNLTLKACQDIGLDGLVLIGATHTLTDSIIVTNFLLKNGCKTSVVAVPATVDGNVHHHMLEASVGFDTATKLYSQLIGNTLIDCASAIKYWYFIKLMGRDPSHLVLECALQTHPNMVIISEELAAKGTTIHDLVQEIADLVVYRSRHGKNFGTILIPEGLLIHLPHTKYMIDELNTLFNKLDKAQHHEIGQKIARDPEFAKTQLSAWTAGLFNSLPEFTKKQLVFEREAHGTVALTQIETERLLGYLVGEELKKRKEAKEYKGSFSWVPHFFGYQGRCAQPSKFDCDLGHTYGYIAGTLIQHGITGYCVTCRGLADEVDNRYCGAIPLLAMSHSKSKSVYGENIAVVPSHEVDLKGDQFNELVRRREQWKLDDLYWNPGPTQFFGSQAKIINLSLQVSHGQYPQLIKKIEELTENIKNQCRFGSPSEVLQVAILNLNNLGATLDIMKKSIAK